MQIKPVVKVQIVSIDFLVDLLHGALLVGELELPLGDEAVPVLVNCLEQDKKEEEEKKVPP